MDEHPGDRVPRRERSARRAVLAGTRLDVWQVIETVRNSGNSVAEAAAYLGLPASRVRGAVDYYALYRDEIDDIAEREHAAAERAEAAWRAGEELLA